MHRPVCVRACVCVCVPTSFCLSAHCRNFSHDVTDGRAPQSPPTYRPKRPNRELLGRAGVAVRGGSGGGGGGGDSLPLLVGQLLGQ